MNIAEIEAKYNYKFPTLFTKLWNDGMLDWLNGHSGEFTFPENWANTIYPKIKDNPPLLLHSGGFDFELLRASEILNFKFDEFWDIDTHKFIPFAKTEEGDIYAFYKNMEYEGENVIVRVWNEMNETEIIAKNFEDFIFRKMLEAVFDIDKDDLTGDYKEDGFEGYITDLTKDLNSITPYISDIYSNILLVIYTKYKVEESMFSYTLLDKLRFKEIIQEHLFFEKLDYLFEHECT